VKPFRERNKTAIGAIGITTIVAALAFSFSLERLPVIGAGDVYNAEFSEAAGLRPNDEVRIAGVKRGKVTAVELAGDRVLVKMRLKDVEFGRESRADIRIKTVLGRKFVMLTPEGAGQMEPGDTIPLARTSSPYDIAEAFQGLASTVDDIDDAQLAKAFTTLADTFRDTPDEVRASLTGLSRLSRTIASRDAELKTLLDRSRGVTEVLAQRDQDLVAFMSDASLLLEEVERRRAAIDALLASTVELSEQLRALVRENTATLQPALARLRDVTDMLRANRASLDKAIPRLAAFTRLFANNLGNGRWFDTLVQNLLAPTGFEPGTFGEGGTTPFATDPSAPTGGAR
jgi:phospholipid/cholesterol/gamma-HCH transport system substrate-binding protein